MEDVNESLYVDDYVSGGDEKLEICERKQKLQERFQAGVSLSENGLQMKNPLLGKSMTNHPMRREKFWVQLGILVKIY